MINNYCKATTHSIDHDKTRNIIVTMSLLIMMTVENLWNAPLTTFNFVINNFNSKLAEQ